MRLNDTKRRAPEKSGQAASNEKETRRLGAITGENSAAGASSGSFPIVGIGASAGGLEAFTRLLQSLRANTGMAFVLVQHLDPVHESALTDLLSRATSLPVHEVTNNLRVEANHVYVIPPNTSLTITGGVLKLQPRQQQRTPLHSIDSFFESLAEDQREKSIGVILSGTATDGTAGLEFIKAEGGITFAQDESAKYDSMPRSAVDAGCVDFVLSPEEIAEELAHIANHPYVAGEHEHFSPEDVRASAIAHISKGRSLPSGSLSSPRTGAKPALAEAEAERNDAVQNGFKKILLLLRNHCRVDFSLYKSTTIQRRITRRMVLNKKNTLDEYAVFLSGNDKELDALYSDMLISVTSFFRNPEAFDVLKRKVFPKLLQRHGDDPFRVWVLGCSTGQEAYTIAMAFVESADRSPRLPRLQVFATDLNDALLEKARHGLYTRNLAQEISPERLRRFFVEEDGGYRVVKSLREMVVFARQNLISDPPFSRMDLVSCRNLLIYLEPSLQQKVLPTFHYTLRPDGFLFLGASESIGGFTDLFEPVDKKHKIYSKKSVSTRAFHLPVKKERGESAIVQGSRPPLAAGRRQGEALDVFPTELNAQREADRVTVNLFAPPGVLINAELQILQFRGSTSAYLELPTGNASFDLLKMARQGLMLPLRAAINKAKKEDRSVRRENVKVDQNSDADAVNIEVVPLKNLRERCFLILFEGIEQPGRARRASSESQSRSVTGTSHTADKKESLQRIVELERELSETRDYLQSIQEQYEAANEELQASNEEVQSASEELQSINEELETSKEELESTNEELTTVNDEMAARNTELNHLNADLTNLQTSTKLAVVLLGRDLTVRRFSAQAEKQFNLFAGDVGRPISGVRHCLDLTDLEAVIAEVIASVQEHTREVRDRDGRWYSLRVRPYITLDNKVDGAVLVLVDIDSLKQSEGKIEAARKYAEAIIETVREPLIVLDENLRVRTANRSFYEDFRVSLEETENKLLYDLGNRQWDIPRLRKLLEEILSASTEFQDFEVEHEFERIGRRMMMLNARRLNLDEVSPPLILLAIEDVTDRRDADTSSAALAAIVSSSDDAIIGKDLNGVITSWNKGAERIFGYTAREAIGQSVTMLIPAERLGEEPEILARLRQGHRIEHFETERVCKDGSRLEISLTSSPIKDAAGRVIGASKIARDITERKRAEAERELLLVREQAARAEADDANRVKDEFLATVSHELRTPLNAIMGWAHILIRGRLDQTSISRGLETIVRNAQAQNQLISDLLDTTRIISGQLRCEMGAVDLVTVVNAAADTVRLAADSKGVHLMLTLDPAAGMVSGDAARLQQIASNLLTNAVKFTPPGGNIEVELKREDTSVLLVVADSGEGISQEFLPHIFDRFRQAEGTSSRQHGGLGIGLAIVQHLVEMHGGTIRAVSQGVGHGTTFTAAFPLLAVCSEPGGLVRGTVAADDLASVLLTGMRILVVDDAADARELVTLALQQGGAEVRASRSVREALDMMEQWTPDVVVSDIGMPGEDGYQLIKKLRASGSRGDELIPAIALTGYASTEDAARALKAGFQLHLPKPVSPSELVATVASLVKKASQA